VEGDKSVTSSPGHDAGPEPGRAAVPDQEHTSAGAAAGLAAIAAEVRALRRGRGLRGDVTSRIGPALRELADGGQRGPGAPPGPAPAGDAAQLRERLAGQLESLAARLPGDLRTAVLAALALHPATRDMRTYELRRDWLAREIDRVARTAERRIDEAQGLLAQEVAAELVRRRGRRSPAAEAEAWYTERFSAVLLLDGEFPEAFERRVIVSNCDGLAELTLAVDVPVDAGRPRLPLRLEVISGGELVTVEEMARTRTRYLIRLPRPLRAGESHEYEVRIRVLPGEPMRDYYVFRPERRCDHFELRVRFDRGRVPAWVRRVYAEDVHSYNSHDGVPPADELVSVDLTGETRVSFGELRPHYGFGLQWGAPQRVEAGCPPRSDAGAKPAGAAG
jgi:hypothetical protein